MNSKLLILIPAHNEERTIGSVVLQAKKYGSVLVVDDGSIDSTSYVAKKAGATIVRHLKNRGYGAAIRTGFATAAARGADVLVTLDADYQHDLNDIPIVAAPVLAGKADVCAGSRFLGKTVDASLVRMEGVKLLNKLAGQTGGVDGLDYQCGFRAYSKKAVSAIRFAPDGYEAGSEILHSASRAGMKIAQVPVTVRYFGEKEGKVFAQGAGLFTYLVSEMAKQRPLVFLSGLGAGLILLSALIGIFVVNTFYSTGALAIGSAFLTVFFGIAGLVLILIGINLYTLETLIEKRRMGGN